MMYEDHLVEFFSPGEHFLAAQYFELVKSFHAARWEAKSARAKGLDLEANAWDSKAEQLAKMVERIQGKE